MKKTTPSKFMAGWAVVTACLVAIPTLASNTPQVESLKKNLKAVSVLEMPAKAADLVSAATSDEREVTAMAVILAAVELKPAAIAPVVGAVSRVAPDAAPSVAATAAMRQPKQAGAITKAAAAAAPGQAAKIAGAVCKQVPTKYNEVAIAAFQAVPGAGKEILNAVVLAVPSLKPFIERSSTDAAGNALVVPAVIADTEQLLATAAVAQKISSDQILTRDTAASSASLPKYEPMAAPMGPPVVGPPFTPVSGSPTEMNRTNTVEVPPGGGRNYSGS
jgi:hypothetical protein